MSRRSDPAHPQGPLPVTRADLARRAGKARSTVTEACSGPLAPACLPGGRVDLSHPVVARWAGMSTVALVRAAPSKRTTNEARLRAPRKLVLEETALAVGELAARTGISAEQLRADLEAALIPAGHVSVREFAIRLGFDFGAARRVLHKVPGAITTTGRVDLGHPALLELAARRPFTLDADGELAFPEVFGDGYLAAAMVGDDIDLDHPVARLFVTRCSGRVANGDELAGGETSSAR